MPEDLDQVAVFRIFKIKEVIGITTFHHRGAMIERQPPFLLPARAVAFVTILRKNRPDSFLKKFDILKTWFLGPSETCQKQ